MKPRMMQMARDFTLISKMGYIVKFSRNKPVSVPPLVIEEAIEKGAGFSDEDAEKEHYTEMKPEDKAVFGPERKALLETVLTKIKEENNPDNFTATGVPKLAVVGEEIGFDVHRKEVNDIWSKMLVDQE